MSIIIDMYIRWSDKGEKFYQELIRRFPDEPMDAEARIWDHENLCKECKFWYSSEMCSHCEQAYRDKDVDLDSVNSFIGKAKYVPDKKDGLKKVFNPYEGFHVPFNCPKRDKMKTNVKYDPYFVYILRCKDKSLYCGITNDLRARIKKHEQGKGAKYTKSRGPFELVFVEWHWSKSEALRSEYYFKKLSKKKKEEIVAKELSSYQKGVIKRYYDNKEDINSQKLGELVSELYLATSEVNKKRLWKSASTSLLSLVEGKPEMKARAEKIIADKDLTELAKIVGEIF